MIGSHMAHDGESKTSTARGPVPGTVHAIKAFKYAFNAVGWNSDAMVFDLNRHRFVGGNYAQLHLM